MKQFLLITLAALFSINSYAQISSGSIVFEILSQSIDSTLDIQENINMFPGSSLQIDFMKNKSRIQFKLSGGFTITNISDLESGKGLRTFQSDKGNFAIPCSAKEAKMTFDKTEEPEIILADEKLQILGYECKKAIVRSGKTETVYWYTEELSFDFSGQNILNTNVPGFPLCFTTISSGIEMTFIAVSIDSKLDRENVFSLEVPEGYMITKDGF
jgi:GLPGLI family protein